MRFKVDRATLLRALAHIQSVAEKRNTIPILANVLLAIEGDKLRLTATDTEIAVVEEVAAEGLRDGTVTAPAAVLHEIVRKLPEGVSIELDHPGGDAPLALRAGRYKTSLNALPVDEFPIMSAGELPHLFSIPAQVLKSLLDRTRFAISSEETRYYLNGIFFHVSSDGPEPVLRAVATDGHRLARVEAPLPTGAEGIPGIIVPKKTISELRKLLDDRVEAIEVSLSETRIRFVVGAVTLTSKLIDGTFPEYERVIPKNNDRHLRVNKQAFSDAVARVSAISQERSRPVKLVVDSNLLTLSAVSPDQGMAKDELDETNVRYDGPSIEIGFQARYLNDITDLIDEEAEFVFGDNAAPTLVRDTNVTTALYVLMPMRV